MRVRIFQSVILMLISGIIGYYVGVNNVNLEWKNYKPAIHVTSKEPPASLRSVDFSAFWNVWQRLEASYYDKKALDPQKLLNGAISGMVSGLEDPYTMYLPPAQNSSFKEGLAGQFSGIGAELGLSGKQIIVVAPLDGSPAQKAGIKPGDAVLKVNGQSTTGWTLSQTVEKIRGPKGSEVALSLLHKSSEKPTDIKILRDTITIKSVEGWIKKVEEIGKLSDEFEKKYKGKEIIYMRLSQFGDHTNQEWLAIVNTVDLEQQTKKNIEGVVLDLRNNPGGYLNDATFVASEFIKNGTIVIQDKGSNGDSTEFTVSRKGLLTDIPVVVILNKGSASASEIVAGALRDHKRAKIVGETSFGKGTIQQAEDLGGGAGLHVTIAKWLTPNGTWVHEKGLTPDVEVVYEQNEQGHDAQLEKAIEELVK